MTKDIELEQLPENLQIAFMHHRFTVAQYMAQGVLDPMETSSIAYSDEFMMDTLSRMTGVKQDYEYFYCLYTKGKRRFMETREKLKTITGELIGFMKTNNLCDMGSERLLDTNVMSMHDKEKDITVHYIVFLMERKNV